ncbi:disease resistance protein [Tanacetum coccineum]
MLQKGALADKLSRKRFLLALNDVWNLIDDEWECLQRCFVKVVHGSKIIVTTWNTNMVRSDNVHNLWVLSNEEALSLLAIHALDDENGNIQSLEMLRHFSFVSQQFGSYSKFKELEGARRLLTFIAIATDVDDR